MFVTTKARVIAGTTNCDQTISWHAVSMCSLFYYAHVSEGFSNRTEYVVQVQPIYRSDHGIKVPTTGSI